MPSMSTDRKFYVQIHSPANPPTDGCSLSGTLGVRETDGTLWRYSGTAWQQLLGDPADPAPGIASQSFITLAVADLIGNSATFYEHPPGAGDLAIVGVALSSAGDLDQPATLTLAINGTSVKLGVNPVSVAIAAGGGVGASASSAADDDNVIAAGDQLRLDITSANTLAAAGTIVLVCNRSF